ncbi:hypothetical protein MKW92_016258 [Papaver armeniacum]|nr:hypothetical protein MKW92_016258 [Papaver armeniacum]
MWNHRRNSITTNWSLYLCINDHKCIRHSSKITANPCQIYSGFTHSQNESYFGYYLFHYYPAFVANSICSCALGCGAYFLASWGIVTSVIGCFIIYA